MSGSQALRALQHKIAIDLIGPHRNFFAAVSTLALNTGLAKDLLIP